MLSDLEREALNRLKEHPRSRRHFCESIHEDLIEYGKLIPGTIISGLEHLIMQADPDNFERKGVAISGTKKMRVRRSFFKKNGREFEFYPLYLFNDVYTLKVPFSKDNPKDIEVSLNLNYSHAYINYHIQNRKYLEKIEPKRGIFGIRHTRSFNLTDYCAVSFALLSEERQTSLSGKTVKMSYEDEGRLLFIIDFKGKFYFYNIFKEMVFRALPRGETMMQSVYRKASDIESESLDFKLDTYPDEIREHLFSRWKENYKEFNHLGRTILIKGSLEKRIGGHGDFYFKFKDKGKFRQSFFVGKKFRKKICRAEIIGPYAMFYMDSGLINAFRTDNIGYETLLMKNISQKIDYIRVRNISSDQDFVNFSTSHGLNKFLKKSMSRTAGINIEKTSTALMCRHSEGHKDKFTLLVDYVGFYREFDISPDYVDRNR